MSFEEIQELIRLVSKKELTEFKLEDDDIKLHIRGKHYQSGKGGGGQTIVSVPTPAPTYAPAPPPTAAALTPPAAPAPAPPTGEKAETAGPEGNYVEVKSPMIGTFYRSSSPDKDPYVKVGDTVAVGDTVCIVEAMKLFNEIEAEVAGTIVKVLVEDAQPIEYDQPLFLVEPA